MNTDEMRELGRQLARNSEITALTAGLRTRCACNCGRFAAWYCWDAPVGLCDACAARRFEEGHLSKRYSELLCAARARRLEELLTGEPVVVGRSSTRPRRRCGSERRTAAPRAPGMIIELALCLEEERALPKGKDE